jgi:hypothetical protein
MSEQVFDVIVTVTKKVRVKVPSEVLSKTRQEDPKEVAEEFALGGRSSWPEYVLSEDENYDVESVTEVAA